MHQSSCVHRDLKLENILLDKHENVKLCDFGFTREYEGKASYLQTFCGTVCYSAPEMLKGEKYAGEKVDVWSLGVILYALLCGELPFDDDNDNVTMVKILSTEPRWPDHLTSDARALLGLLLSKRPLLRPSLTEILCHPFIAEFAPQQQAILKVKHPAPFATSLEKETLQRMRSAGVDIDQVIENVLSQRCDGLAGWWSLLIEKEQRKQVRRELKRKERDAEVRVSRRLSGASSRRAPNLREINEEGQFVKLTDPPKSRGRKERRSAHYPELVVTDLPELPENTPLATERASSEAPPPIEKDHSPGTSSSRQRRPVPPPKEGFLRSAKSRGSTLQLVSPSQDLLSPEHAIAQRPSRRRHQHAIINHLAHWKHWLFDSARRAKSPISRNNRSTPNLRRQTSTDGSQGSKDLSARPITAKTTITANGINSGPDAEDRPPAKSRMYTVTSSRHSISPSPLTPRSAYRKSSIGLRGRKSTSSSVSSVRSIHHHHHTHSKASSISSNGSGSHSTTKIPLVSRSPHHSVKVLPATPTLGYFPSNIRVARHSPTSVFNEGSPWGAPGSPSPGGLVFAKRKKNIFKGPMLNTSPMTGLHHGGSSGSAQRTGSHSRNTSLGGGSRTGAVIEEEDEDDIEEVDAFTPITGPGMIEETIFPAPIDATLENHKGHNV